MGDERSRHRRLATHKECVSTRSITAARVPPPTGGAAIRQALNPILSIRPDLLLQFPVTVKWIDPLSLHMLGCV
jgi:hypothetical protein